MHEKALMLFAGNVGPDQRTNLCSSNLGINCSLTYIINYIH